MKKSLIVLFVVGPLIATAIAVIVASRSSVSSDTDRQPLPGEGPVQAEDIESDPEETEGAADAVVPEEVGAGPVAVEFVEVAADGTQFDPPVQKAQIRDGIWICDMNTVHFASQEEGDGRCPVCGMHLTYHAGPDNP